MTRLATTQARQAHWREVLARQESSGLSAAAFCQREGIAPQTFYWWRTKLGGANRSCAREQSAASFLDLGALPAPVAHDERTAGFDLRLELPGGIVLTIART